MGEVFLKLNKIRKSYPGVEALKGIDLEIRKGEIHCLAGGNGCGKSTLIKIISGIVSKTSGEIYLEGKQIKSFSPKSAINSGIQVIYQDFAVFPNLTVKENIAINHLIKNNRKFVSEKNTEEIAKNALKKLDLDIDINAKLSDLPVSSKQLVAICRALVDEPKLLILDEPTTTLTSKEVNKLWDILRKLREQNIAILLVDHKFDEIRPLVDRLTIIRNGEFISSDLIENYGHVRFQVDITGHDFSKEKYSPEVTDETLLEVDKLSLSGKFYDISFKINKGDVLGITGLLGSGRNEIAESLFGITPAEKGKIILHGKEIKIRNINDAIKNDIGFVPEDRISQGLFLEMKISENIACSSLKKYEKNGAVNEKSIESDSEKYIKELNIKATSGEDLVKSLSGGNAQKVVISKWLNTSPKLLILVGPTVGMDVGAKAEIHEILHDLAKNGCAILMVTDDIPELVENCNKILIMRNNRIIKETDNSISKKDVEALLLGDEVNE